MSLSRFIASHIYTDKNAEQNRISRPAIRIALLGIIIGTAVMILSIAVIMGFKRQITEKITGFGSHLQVLSLTRDQNNQIMPILTNDSLKSVIMQNRQVAHVQPYVQIMGMIKTDDDFLGMQFKGIDEDYDTTFLHVNLVEGYVPHFSSKEASNKIVLSKYITNKLKLSINDKIYAYYISQSGMRARRFEIVGIYQSNLSEYDKSIVITDIYTLRKIQGWDKEQSTAYEIQIKDFNQLQIVTDQLVDKINHNFDRNGCTYGVFNIKEIAPNIFSWLGVLDMNVIIILVLMLLVSIVTIMSGLLIIMLEQVSMIGLLKALGATNGAIRKIFARFAFNLIFKGVVIGNIAAFIVAAVQYYTHIIKLDAETYYIDSVPIEFHWQYFIIIDIATLLITFAVVFCSTHLVSINKPAETLHFE